jgi:D-lyxose ketol-isomerase
MVEKELTCPGCRHTAVYRFVEGKDPCCVSCGAEIDLTPGVQALTSAGRVKGGQFSNKLQKFLNTKVSDIDDDPTDDHFLTPDVKVVKKGVAKLPPKPDDERKK